MVSLCIDGSSRRLHRLPGRFVVGFLDDGRRRHLDGFVGGRLDGDLRRRCRLFTLLNRHLGALFRFLHLGWRLVLHRLYFRDATCFRQLRSFFLGFGRVLCVRSFFSFLRGLLCFGGFQFIQFTGDFFVFRQFFLLFMLFLVCLLLVGFVDFLLTVFLFWLRAEVFFGPFPTDVLVTFGLLGPGLLQRCRRSSFRWRLLLSIRTFLFFRFREPALRLNLLHELLLELGLDLELAPNLHDVPLIDPLVQAILEMTGESRIGHRVTRADPVLDLLSRHGPFQVADRLHDHMRERRVLRLRCRRLRLPRRRRPLRRRHLRLARRRCRRLHHHSTRPANSVERCRNERRSSAVRAARTAQLQLQLRPGGPERGSPPQSARSPCSSNDGPFVSAGCSIGIERLRRPAMTSLATSVATAACLKTVPSFPRPCCPAYRCWLSRSRLR
ncbi:hypothetical protein PBRA_003269 [Plasmodiophora brassicae]|uniref:Uncharacterized protein n=1 Tax=Plasmodiophora brassicae TaxID=37360 RepID=A0A0G4J7U2_PLABS|nr:hypothetical protein PBRA_003269 [Plasmodiophora brassicae]